jgi:hypothetical protein
MNFIDHDHIGLVVDTEAQELLSKSILKSFVVHDDNIDAITEVAQFPSAGFDDEIGGWKS